MCVVKNGKADFHTSPKHISPEWGVGLKIKAEILKSIIATTSQCYLIKFGFVYEVNSYFVIRRFNNYSKRMRKYEN